jgi:beta-lactamase regulating signal transducer with metallopeptidase domain
MSFVSFLVDAARGAVLLGLALAAMPLLRGAPASTRRLVLSFALGAAALVPVASRVAPAWQVVRVAEMPAVGRVVAEPAGEAVAAPVAAQPAAAPAAAISAAPARGGRPVPWGIVLAVVWGLGASAVVARLVIGIARAQGIVRRARPMSRAVIGAAEREVGARAEVRVSEEIDAPMVTGALWPVVLVPRAALGWSDERLRAVLLHELAHVRQRDCLAQIVGQIACAMHWFDPLAWLAAHRLRTEREISADERVLSTGALPSEYAEHLLAIAAGAARVRAVPDGALGMAERSQLLQRVEAIVRPGAARARTTALRAAGIGGAAAALLGAVACVTAGGDSSGVATPAASSGAPAAPLSSSAPAQGGSLESQVASAVGAKEGGVELTIDRGIQAIVDEEMKRLDADWHPLATTAIVLDPASGEVRALTSPEFATRPRGPGSTMKPLLVAAALEDGAVAPSDRFDCGNGTRSYGELTLRDASPNGTLDVAQILTVSSNIGASRIFDKLGGAGLGRWLGRFHFGEPTGIQLREPAVEKIPAGIETGTFAGGALASGHGSALRPGLGGDIASPLHMAAAYAVIASGGVYNAPTLVRDGSPGASRRTTNERLLRPETARTVIGMLERVVYDEHGTGQAARVEGARVAGKTGTADQPEGSPGRYYSSFIGAVPADAPRFVILVGALLADEKGVGGKVAAPAFARIAARALGR